MSENVVVGKFAVGKYVSENLPSEKLCRKIFRRKNCCRKNLLDPLILLPKSVKYSPSKWYPANSLVGSVNDSALHRFQVVFLDLFPDFQQLFGTPFSKVSVSFLIGNLPEKPSSYIMASQFKPGNSKKINIGLPSSHSL